MLARFRRWLLATLVLIILPAAAPEPAGILSPTPLDSITATATRTPQAAGDVAAPLRVVPRAELLRRQPGNLQSIIGDLPGVEADGTAGCTVVAVLHDPMLAGAYADRLLVLGKERRVAEGPAAELLTPEVAGRAYGLRVRRVPDAEEGPRLAPAAE